MLDRNALNFVTQLRHIVYLIAFALLAFLSGCIFSLRPQTGHLLSHSLSRHLTGVTLWDTNIEVPANFSNINRFPPLKGVEISKNNQKKKEKFKKIQWAISAQILHIKDKVRICGSLDQEKELRPTVTEQHNELFTSNPIAERTTDLDSQIQFIQLLTSHQGRLYAYILTLIGDADQARDVMQETNTVLWQKADQFELGTNFSAWMMKTAYYQVMAYRQKRSREKLVFDDEITAQLAETANERNDKLDQQMMLLNSCIEKLSDRHQEMIRYRYQEGFEMEKMAEFFDRSAAAIKQALFRARANLIQCVQTQGQVQE